MKRILLQLVFSLGVGIAIGLYAHEGFAFQDAAPKRTMLLTEQLSDMGDKELRMWITELPPRAVTPKHFHPGHVVGFVLEGSVVSTVEGRQPVVIRTGQAWHESEKEIHWGRNPSNSAPVRFLAVQVADKGQPMMIQSK